MADPAWGIWGKCPPPPCGGAMRLIKIATSQTKISLLTHENVHILLT